jgi:AcrR family transcriptional regulator
MVTLVAMPTRSTRYHDPRRASRRRARERTVVEVTRRLFDERGTQDAPIEEIARAAGINRALIYRSFASKEELFILTVTHYLDELTAGAASGVASSELTAGAAAPAEDPVVALRAALDYYTTFCLQYPAFLDCALSLMRRPARELRELVSDSVWLRLGQAMAAALHPLAEILRAGAQSGAFAIDDPDFVANRLYTHVLGTMHLARIGLGVRQAAPGVPDTFRLEPEQVRAACVQDAMAAARVVA